MFRPLAILVLCGSAALLTAQQGPEQQPDSKVTLPKKSKPPRSDQRSSNSSDKDGDYSSSKDTLIDLSAPLGDKQTHLDSENSSDINEMRPWNPHRALKDVEVGDYYLKRKNYRAAEARYRDALEYKPNDAMATFRLGQVMEKTHRSEEAVRHYQSYLKILPQGEFSEECHKAIERLSNTAQKQTRSD